MEARICKLGASSVAGGVITVQCVDSVGKDAEDVEPFGSADVFSALGLYALPCAANENGHAEALLLSPCSGLNAAVAGARDTRAGEYLKEMVGGDTCLACTHPDSQAHLQLKGVKRQAALFCNDSKGETMMVQLDGKADQIMITGFECVFKMKEGEVSITNGSAMILMKDGVIYLAGTVVLGGLAPFAPIHSGVGGGPTSIPTPGILLANEQLQDPDTVPAATDPKSVAPASAGIAELLSGLRLQAATLADAETWCPQPVAPIDS